ncbi:MAG: hypothetical protein IPI85_11110 [Dehalococcoidia bacterium]|nr:hypothetical protein [Dehalococcoidia bacterium]MBK8560871.1 hypothetical protein [Dehalococcoidia bacterium]
MLACDRGFYAWGGRRASGKFGLGSSYSGTGEPIVISNLFGWIEQHEARW